MDAQLNQQVASYYNIFCGWNRYEVKSSLELWPDPIGGLCVLFVSLFGMLLQCLSDDGGLSTSPCRIVSFATAKYPDQSSLKTPQKMRHHPTEEYI